MKKYLDEGFNSSKFLTDLNEIPLDERAEYLEKRFTGELLGAIRSILNLSANQNLFGPNLVRTILEKDIFNFKDKPNMSTLENIKAELEQYGEDYLDVKYIMSFQNRSDFVNLVKRYIRLSLILRLGHSSLLDYVNPTVFDIGKQGELQYYPAGNLMLFKEKKGAPRNFLDICCEENPDIVTDLIIRVKEKGFLLIRPLLLVLEILKSTIGSFDYDVIVKERGLPSQNKSFFDILRLTSEPDFYIERVAQHFNGQIEDSEYSAAAISHFITEFFPNQWDNLMSKIDKTRQNIMFKSFVNCSGQLSLTRPELLSFIGKYCVDFDSDCLALIQNLKLINLATFEKLANRVLKDGLPNYSLVRQDLLSWGCQVQVENADELISLLNRVSRIDHKTSSMSSRENTCLTFLSKGIGAGWDAVVDIHTLLRMLPYIFQNSEEDVITFLGRMSGIITDSVHIEEIIMVLRGLNFKSYAELPLLDGIFRSLSHDERYSSFFSAGLLVSPSDSAKATFLTEYLELCQKSSSANRLVDLLCGKFERDSELFSKALLLMDKDYQRLFVTIILQYVKRCASPVSSLTKLLSLSESESFLSINDIRHSLFEDENVSTAQLKALLKQLTGEFLIALEDHLSFIKGLNDNDVEYSKQINENDRCIGLCLLYILCRKNDQVKGESPKKLTQLFKNRANSLQDEDKISVAVKKIKSLRGESVKPYTMGEKNVAKEGRLKEILDYINNVTKQAQTQLTSSSLELVSSNNPVK